MASLPYGELVVRMFFFFFVHKSKQKTTNVSILLGIKVIAIDHTNFTKI